MEKKQEHRLTAPHRLQQDIFRSYLLLIIVLAVLMAATGSLINIAAESRRRDQNLQNVAESVAHSQLLTQSDACNAEMLTEYLDSLMSSLSSVDVISVVSADNVRLYHSTHELINTTYDGTEPAFSRLGKDYYSENSSGPSGSQRRAYAAVYGADGSYKGFVLAVMLMTTIHTQVRHTLLLYGLVALCVMLLSLLLSMRLSKKIKTVLMGYEPDDFSAMYKIRDNILGALDEGIIAVDRSGRVQFVNEAAAGMLGHEAEDLAGCPLESLSCREILSQVLEQEQKIQNTQWGASPDANILYDASPIRDGAEIVGAVGILHDRTEYTKLMEDLAGTRYLVDSMRANNHDFTNKLHVILGLIQMEMYDRAKSYIESISIVQSQTISQIMHSVDDASVAALLVGKIARASEVNVKLTLRENFCYSAVDMPLPSGALVTIIGNLIDNALEAMNDMDGDYQTQRVLIFGIFSRPGALLISVEDNGPGIEEGLRERVFENGFSTKGEGHGTGLYHVKKLVESLGGSISLESQVGEGSVFTVSFNKAAGGSVKGE